VSCTAGSNHARCAGKSLSDDLLDEIRFVAERPPLDDVRTRLRSQETSHLSVAPAEAVRAERGRSYLHCLFACWQHFRAVATDRYPLQDLAFDETMS
jgi:hypothetical protein